LKGADYADSGSTKESKESHGKGSLNNLFIIYISKTN
jgi:hypothetical protein